MHKTQQKRWSTLHNPIVCEVDRQLPHCATGSEPQLAAAGAAATAHNTNARRFRQAIVVRGFLLLK